MNSMLKKEAMAKKVAKFKLNDVMKDLTDNSLKERVLQVLEEVYIGGYDLAIQICKDDNSKDGFAMAEHLEFLNDDGTIKYE